MSYTKLFYHMITATKNRSPLISSKVELVITKTITQTLKSHGVLIEMGAYLNHIHIACSLKPTVTVSDIVRDIKKKSSQAIRNKYGPEFRWQSGYGAVTVNPYDFERLVLYIRNQKHHHESRTIWPKYEHIGDDE